MKMKRIVNVRRDVLKRSWMLGFLIAACGLTMSAQTAQTVDQQTIVNKNVEQQQVVGSDHQVISNFFKDNWFVLC